MGGQTVALRAFRKIVFLVHELQSVEILLSGTVVSDRFTHRPWPSRARAFGALRNSFRWRLIINL